MVLPTVCVKTIFLATTFDPMDRKEFLSFSMKAAVGALFVAPVLGSTACNTPEAQPTEGGEGTAPAAGSLSPLVLAQIALPYAYNALEPVIDAETMEIHYSKHHAAYVKNANEAIAAEGVQAQDEADLFARISAFSPKVRNNAGGVWNHNFFWEVMAPVGQGGAPEGKLLDAINASFGSVDQFKAAFTEAAMKRFGSGWAWLVEKDGKLLITSTPNQDNPLMDVSEIQGKPLLGLDVWEHAYYLHYQNKRNDYVANWWQVVNWNAVAKRLG